MSSALPFGKFFWSDYASDPALKMCSFAAQGLWMRMLCIAAESDPAGYVAVNGRGLDAAMIARVSGGSLEEVDGLLSELEINGVFSRDRRGWIYSRRMIRDAKKARNARENGKKGGNPNLSKERENPPSDNGEDKPHIPEARNQKQEEKKNGGAEAPGGKYVFEGHTIRLERRHFDQWKADYNSIPDLNAELRTLDGWWQDQSEDRRKKWFHPTMGMLNRKHQQNLSAEKAEAAAASGWDGMA
jgi:hypothetical protein